MVSNLKAEGLVAAQGLRLDGPGPAGFGRRLPPIHQSAAAVAA
jgi:hypothetical protein